MLNQRGANRMRDLHDIHISEIIKAQEDYNRAIEAAGGVYNNAIHRSREKFLESVEYRMNVLHNGNPRVELNVIEAPSNVVELLRADDGVYAEAPSDVA